MGFDGTVWKSRYKQGWALELDPQQTFVFLSVKWVASTQLYPPSGIGVRIIENTGQTSLSGHEANGTHRDRLLGSYAVLQNWCILHIKLNF